MFFAIIFRLKKVVPTAMFIEKLVEIIFVKIENKIFRGSSAVEQLAVNQLVAGSIPAHGARIIFKKW